MKILAIDTSCDETAVAVTEGRKVLSHIEYSQIVTHKEWGGVVPSLAKRAHAERIDFVINEALRKSKKKGEEIDFIAITQGPGLAIALEVGISKAKELSQKYHKPLISVNHMEGHIYSSFVQNSKGNPQRNFEFPYLSLLVSGGHTEIVIFKDHLSYKVIGKKIDDAAGEALDKAARMLGFQYPGGPIIERLAKEAGNKDIYKFPRPMIRSDDLNFSFSGLKTSFLYFLKKMGEGEKNTHIRELASAFQEAVFESLVIKTEKAMKQTGIKRLAVGGGVIANKRLRNLLRNLVKKHSGSVIFPCYSYLTGDNAGMIGVVASFKGDKGMIEENINELDRIPRMSL